MPLFPRRRGTNPMLTTSALPEDYYNPIYLGMHQRSLRATMYGIGDVVRAIIDDGKVKFQYTRSGNIFESMKDAFEAAGKEGVTTFARLTGTKETSSLNTRGLAGFEERLIVLQNEIRNNPALARRFNITNPTDIAFEVGTFKTGMGEKDRLTKIIDTLGEGLIVPDGDEFNFFQIKVGKDRLLSFEEMNDILFRTSKVDDQFLGGFFSSSKLTEALGQEGGLTDLFSKYGKRARGAIGVRDVSLTGDILNEALTMSGISGTGLSEQNVKIFKISEDMQKIATKYLETQVPGSTVKDVTAYILEGLDDEAKAFYEGGDRTLNLISGALDLSGITDFATASKKQQDIFKQSVESAYDGTAVINSKFFRAVKSQMQEELRQLKGMTNITPEINERMLELQSQIANMNPENFQAITSRIFLPFKENGKITPRMIKAVVDQAGLKSPLQKYAVVAADVVVKKEAGLMGPVSDIKLVLQGDTSSKVYYDPLAPAFHYDIFSSPTYVKAQEARISRITQSFQNAVETGQINESLKRSIYEMAEQEIDGLPDQVRSMKERNRLYMRRLKEAIESGVDVRTMPELLNYLGNYVQSQLYREKDGVFQIAMDNVFRVSLDTESSFYAGRESTDTAFSVGRGLRDLEIAKGISGEKRNIQAVEFSIQGHKMLFGGNTARLFKQSLGGFDLDDKGIVMPRLLQDADGEARLGAFIFRQPTGPAEFIFAMPKFGTADTVKMFLQSSDALMNQLEEIKNEDKYFQLMYESLTAKGARKTEINRQLASYVSQDEIAGGIGQIEKAFVNLMGRAQTSGNYVVQTLTGQEKIFDILSRAPEGLASPLQLTKKIVQDMLQANMGIEENLLVSQYQYGEMTRVFNEAKSFSFDRFAQEELRKAGITGRISTETVGNAIKNAEAAGDMEKSMKLQGIVSKIYQEKTREALSKKANIGSYINRLVVASASADQEEKIYTELRAKGLGTAVDDITRATNIAAISPSDVVDLINYMSGDQKLLGTQNYYMQLGEMIKAQGGDPIKSINGIEKVLKKQGIELSESIAQAAIEQKFSRIGMLRARSMQAGLDPSLMAGIDVEFLRSRLKSSDDAARALQALESGFTDEATKVRREATLSKEINDQINDYSMQLQSARNAQDYNLTNELMKVAGLSNDSVYAHASKNVKLGQLAKDSMDATNAQLYGKSTMANMSEVKVSREASTLAENILKQFQSMQEQSMSVIDLADVETSQISDLMKARKIEQAQIVGTKLRSMIIGAAQSSASTTVQDILDNMERLTFTSRYKNLSKYRNIITGIGDENDIINLTSAARDQREIAFLQKQQNISSLTDQLDDMVQQLKGMSQEDRAYMLSQSRDILDASIRTRKRHRYR